MKKMLHGFYLMVESFLFDAKYLFPRGVWILFGWWWLMPVLIRSSGLIAAIFGPIWTPVLIILLVLLIVGGLRRCGKGGCGVRRFSPKPKKQSKSSTTVWDRQYKK